MDNDNIHYSAARDSMFDVRLISPIHGLNFLGRLEVNYNNSGWGTVCDYSFYFSSSNVICSMLNYTRATCTATNAVMGQGSGEFYFCYQITHSEYCDVMKYACTYEVTPSS